MSDYLVKCDRSGFVCLKSETRKTWDGLIVRKDFWEPRQPQDILPLIAEGAGPKEVRNDQEDPALFDGNMYYDLGLFYDQMLSYEVPTVFDVSMII